VTIAAAGAAEAAAGAAEGTGATTGAAEAAGATGAAGAGAPRGAAASEPRRAPVVVSTGAGWLLGLLLWGWVVLPFTKGGPVAVKNVWMAKFLNKAPDGSDLP
jgi:hypothetical protein